MKANLVLALIAVPTLFMSTQLSAALVTINGDTMTLVGTTNTTSNIGNSSQFEDEFGIAGMQMYYKSDHVEGQASGSDSGTFASSYNTMFSPISDPTDATISWVPNSDWIVCPDCYLLVKDGAATPAQYLFDLANWNGQNTISLTGFWDGVNGAISNVAIWGARAPSTVPEPATLGLLGIGLLGLGLAATRRRDRNDSA